MQASVKVSLSRPSYNITQHLLDGLEIRFILKMSQSILHKHYADKVVPELMKKFGYKNPHQVPTIKKIVINSGFSATADKNHVQYLFD